MKRPDQLVATLVRSMSDYPHEWCFNVGSLEHEPSSITLWVGGGKSFLSVTDPFIVPLGWNDRRKLWKAIQKLRNQRIATLIDKVHTG